MTSKTVFISNFGAVAAFGELGDQSWYATEANAQFLIPGNVGGQISSIDHICNIASTAILRINGANTISAPSAGSGSWVHNIDTEVADVNAGDLIAMYLPTVNSSHFSYTRGWFQGDKYTTKLISGRVQTGCKPANNTTHYFTLDGQGGPGGGAALANVQCARIRSAGTWRGLSVRIQTNNCASTHTVRSNIGGSNGNQVISIGSNVTGRLSDTTNSDSVANNSLLAISVTGSGTTAAASVLSARFESVFECSNNQVDQFYDIPTAALPFAQPLPWYFGLPNPLATSVAAANVLSEIVCPGKTRFSKLRMQVRANSLGQAANVVFQMNGSNATQILSIGNNVTGFFEDTSHVDNGNLGDRGKIVMTSTSTGGSISFNLGFSYEVFNENNNAQIVG